MLAFENDLEYWNSDLNALIYNQFSTLCEIWVRFGSVTQSLSHKNLYGWHQKFYHT